MSYTGHYEIQTLTERKSHRLRTIEEVLKTVEHIEQVTGQPLKHKKLDAARKSADLLTGARRAASDLQATAESRLAETARNYRAGKVTAVDLAVEAASLASARTAGAEVSRLTERAISVINSEALTDAYAIEEDVWLKPIKARAATFIEEATEIAERMDRKPRAARAGVRTSVRPLEPTPIELRDITVRHNWERLEHVLNELDAVHRLADTLRMAGIIPTVEGRTLAEDYRWLNLHELDGNPGHRREFWLANHDTAAPGIYSSAELQEAGGTTVTRHPMDAYSASAQAAELAADNAGVFVA
jgi:hypothetical protein